MKFDKNAAERAGAQGTQTGAHVGKLLAKKLIAKTGTQGIEFTLQTSPESEIKYLTVYYEKADGSIINSGYNNIMAIIGLLGLDSVELESLSHEAEIREFKGKPIGLVLQKVLFTYEQGQKVGQDGYKFEIRLPFDWKTRQTMKEKAGNKPAAQVDAYLENLTDRDDRKASGQQAASGWGQPQQPQGGQDFDDDIPF